MAEMIVISRKRFDELLAEARNGLQRERFKAVVERSHQDVGIIVQDMERIFNYELVGFANKLREE